MAFSDIKSPHYIAVGDSAETTKYLVHSRIDYGNMMLYGMSDPLLHRLEMVKHSVATEKRALVAVHNARVLCFVPSTTIAYL